MFQAVESNEEMNEMQNDSTEHGERRQLERGGINYWDVPTAAVNARSQSSGYQVLVVR